MGDPWNPGGSADFQRGIFCIVIFGTGIGSYCGSTVFGEAVPGLAQLVTIQSRRLYLFGDFANGL